MSVIIDTSKLQGRFLCALERGVRFAEGGGASYAAEISNAFYGQRGACKGHPDRCFAPQWKPPLTVDESTVSRQMSSRRCRQPPSSTAKYRPTLRLTMGKRSYGHLNISWENGSLTGNRMANAGPVRPAIVFWGADCGLG